MSCCGQLVGHRPVHPIADLPASPFVAARSKLPVVEDPVFVFADPPEVRALPALACRDVAELGRVLPVWSRPGPPAAGRSLAARGLLAHAPKLQSGVQGPQRRTTVALPRSGYLDELSVLRMSRPIIPPLKPVAFARGLVAANDCALVGQAPHLRAHCPGALLRSRELLEPSPWSAVPSRSLPPTPVASRRILRDAPQVPPHV